MVWRRSGITAMAMPEPERDAKVAKIHRAEQERAPLEVPSGLLQDTAGRSHETTHRGAARSYARGLRIPADLDALAGQHERRNRDRHQGAREGSRAHCV